MYKNQLQELAQRSCVSLPAYTCIREGPDHAPRFKAAVSFNGEIFESPSYCTTLRQAEHSAAELALNTLSRRGGPAQTLAAKILDETSVCKNLLQETAQRAGLSLPIYTTLRAGPGHLPVFKCIVEVAGRMFAGEPAKTKKQAEKNAAMVAWSAIKQLREPWMNAEGKEEDRNRGGYSSSALTLYRGSERKLPHVTASSRSHGSRSRIRVVNVRERNWRSREGSPAGLFYSNSSPQASDVSHDSVRSFSSSSSSAISSNENLRPGIMMMPTTTTRNQAFFSTPNTIDSTKKAPTMLLQDALSSGASGSFPLHPSLQMQMQHRPPRLSLQSHSDRYELRRSLVEEIQKEGDDEWLSVAAAAAAAAAADAHMQQKQQQQSVMMNSCYQQKRAQFQSQSERFELKPSLLDELYHRDEEDWWLRGEVTRPMAMLERGDRSSSSSSSMYCWDQDIDSGRYYDGNRGLHPSVSYSNTNSSSSNSDCITYSGNNNGYKDISYNVGGGSGGGIGIGEDFSSGVGSKNGSSYLSPYTGSCEGLNLPSSSYAAALNIASELGAATTSTSAYPGFSSDASSKLSLYTNEDARRTFGSPAAAAAAGGFSAISNNNEGSSSSADIWLPAPQSTKCNGGVPTGSMSFGMRPASSLAPPVRVRHMVAVCSAPPSQRSEALTGTMINNGVASVNCLHDPSDACISSEKSTCQLFSQLRF